MQRTTPILVLVLTLSGCGAAATSASSSETTATATETDALSPRELAKLDDVLRARLDQSEATAIFPIRVKFNARPSRDDLTELFLVALEGDAVGRVDRTTLEAIAKRSDVAHIVFVDAGYAEDDDEFE